MIKRSSGKTPGIVCILLIMVLLAACGAPAAQSPAQSEAEGPADDLAAALANMKPLTLNWAICMGSSHRANEVFNYFCDRVNELTEGKVTITQYAGETLVKNTDIYESLKNGIVDMGEADPSYSFSYFPLISAYFLSGISFNSSQAATYAADEWFRSDFAELRDVKYLWAFGMSPSDLLTNKKIETLADFKGVQIRATGYAISAVERLGASAVGITPAETYEALLKGTADAALMPSEALINWNFGEVLKYDANISGLSTVTHYIAMNMDRWNSLPPAVQQVFLDVSAECVDMIAPLWDEMDKEGIAFGEQNGMEYYDVPLDVLQTWWDALAPLQDEWVQERAAKGLDAQAALDRLKSLAEKYNARY
ncbi:MAG: TRAP transporter substrate-binding protein DctP [Gracilibacteraceae bacterium]|jgi:TRAP-type C4-dicarboxylate transport system substrate-binding protein|nr:TRAP transporter substrate-binding protein DctP [Gracilibacteraceae bacterium]